MARVMKHVLAWTMLLAFAMWGWLIGRSRGRPCAGFFLGLGLGPTGIIFALLLPREVEDHRVSCER